MEHWHKTSIGWTSDKRNWTSDVSMLAHRLRRWLNIATSLVHRLASSVHGCCYQYCTGLLSLTRWSRCVLRSIAADNVLLRPSTLSLISRGKPNSDPSPAPSEVVAVVLLGALRLWKTPSPFLKAQFMASWEIFSCRNLHNSTKVSRGLAESCR